MKHLLLTTIAAVVLVGWMDIGQGSQSIAPKVEIEKKQLEKHFNERPESKPPEVGPFSLVIIPDTQIYAYNKPAWRKSSRAEVFVQMTRWIAANSKRQNIKFALHMGDIVTTYDNEKEWAVADKAMSVLDNVVPYCFTVGNHDLAMEGSNVRNSTFFNKTFPYKRYIDQPWYGGRLKNDGFLPKDNYDNSYHFFTGGGQKYIIVSIEVGPTDKMLDWADSIISEHPEHRAIVITHSYLDGHDVRDADANTVLESVSHYAAAIDVTARWWQKQGAGGQWIRGKSFDTFCPIGALADASTVTDPQALRIITRLNGHIVQDAPTSDMIFPVATLLAEVSRGTTLLQGTVILTGTPGGVGSKQSPPVWLKNGDVVQVEIQGVGTVRNEVRTG